jgi:hypothetical protein
MYRELVTVSLLLLAVIAAKDSLAQSQNIERQSSSSIEDLGSQRYRIGEIQIDKAAGMFKVPGRVLRDEPPLEFLVVTRGGSKSYESLLEVNSDAFQFNLACILIGLDASHAASNQYDLSEPVKGDPVEVTVSWLRDGKRVSVNGSELLLYGNPPQAVASRDWVYTGSVELPDGSYLAALSGTLLGFMHRAESVIEHRDGIGLGNYGGVRVNRDLVPAVGSSIELTIRKLKTGK